jgi:hypothetical protein
MAKIALTIFSDIETGEASGNISNAMAPAGDAGEQMDRQIINF